MSPARHVATLSVLAILVGGACDATARRESRALLLAVERFRAAPAAEQDALLRIVADTACSEKLVCDTKAACVESFESTAESRRLRREVEHDVAMVRSGEIARDSEGAKALPSKLIRAEAQLQSGKEQLGRCEEGLVALRTRYGGG